MIEALLRFYYKDGRGPGPRRRHLLRGAVLARHRGGARRPALRRADLRSAARPPRPGPGADRDRRALGAHPATSTCSPSSGSRSGRGAFFVVTIANVLAAIALTVVLVVGAGRGRARPAARQLRQRRRLRARPDRRPPPPPLAPVRPRSAAADAALRPSDDAGRALPLRAQLRRPDHHRPHRRRRRGRPLLARRQVRPGGQRPGPRLPARLAAARLLDPRRRRGEARLRRGRHLVPRRLRLRRRRHVAARALDRPRPRRAGVLRLLRSGRPDLHRGHPLRPLHGARRHPRPHRPHRVQLPGDARARWSPTSRSTSSSCRRWGSSAPASPWSSPTWSSWR